MLWKHELLSSRICRLNSVMRRCAALLWHGVLALLCALWVFEPAAWGQRTAPLESLRREFQRRQTGEVLPTSHWRWYILGVLALVAVLGVAVWMVERFRSRRPYTSRWLLFLELCWVHRLRWREIWELWGWIRREKIHPPARIFCEPELWEDRVDFMTLAAGGRDGSPWTALYERCFGRLTPTARTLAQASPGSAEPPPRTEGN